MNKHKYVAFDIEISREIPDDSTDWKQWRPLGITCAAAVSSEGELWNWYANDNGRFTPQMTAGQCREVVSALDHLMADGYKVVTWNGLGFDFDVLAEESGLLGACQHIALNHIDVMFHFLCVKGFPLGLDAASKGMGLPGKPEGMTGAKAPQLWANKEYHRVLDYVSWDVKNTLDVALTIETAGQLNWQSRAGRPNTCHFPNGLLVVNEAIALPEPNTSWMTDPLTRKSLVEWAQPEETAKG